MGPSVVSAVKSGAVSPNRIDIICAPPFRKSMAKPRLVPSKLIGNQIYSCGYETSTRCCRGARQILAYGISFARIPTLTRPCENSGNTTAVGGSFSCGLQVLQQFLRSLVRDAYTRDSDAPAKARSCHRLWCLVARKVQSGSA